MDTSKIEVKFGEWIEAGFNLWKANMGLLIVATLIALLLSGITIGILAGPMVAGLTLIIAVAYREITAPAALAIPSNPTTPA